MQFDSNIQGDLKQPLLNNCSLICPRMTENRLVRSSSSSYMDSVGTSVIYCSLVIGRCSADDRKGAL